MLTQEQSGLVSVIAVLAVITVAQIVLLIVTAYVMRLWKKVVPQPSLETLAVPDEPAEQLTITSHSSSTRKLNLPDSWDTGGKLSILDSLHVMSHN